MSWAAVSDEMHSDPEVFSAGAEAIGLWAMARSWMAHKLSDGRITKDAAFAIARSLGSKRPANVIAKLVASGLWREVDGGYEDVRYLSENPTRQRVLEKKALAASRQGSWRGRKVSDSNASTNASTNASRNAVVTLLSPTPSPLSSLRSESPPKPPGGLVDDGQTPTEPTPANGRATPGATVGPRRPFAKPAAAQVATDDQEPVETPPSPGNDEAPTGLSKAEQIERNHARYAAAYSAGVSSETGAPHEVAPRDRAVLAGLLPTHAVVAGKPLRLDALDAWLKERGAAFVRATRHEARFQSGYSPNAFLKWLNAGAPPAPVNGSTYERPKTPGRRYPSL